MPQGTVCKGAEESRQEGQEAGAQGGAGESGSMSARTGCAEPSCGVLQGQPPSGNLGAPPAPTFGVSPFLVSSKRPPDPFGTPLGTG